MVGAIAGRAVWIGSASSNEFLDLVALRLMGESATDLFRAGTSLGRVAKVWAVSKSLPPGLVFVAAVVIEDSTLLAWGPPRCFNWRSCLTVSPARKHIGQPAER